MVVLYCVISFILGWRLSSWAKSEPFAAARKAYVESSVSTATTGLVDQEQVSDKQPSEVPDNSDISISANEADPSGAWLFDTSFLALSQDETDINTDAQVEKYFIDNFFDTEQLLSQRLSALKAALSMNASLLDESLLDCVYQLLVEHVDEGEDPEDMTYLLSLLQGRMDEERLPGIAIYLRSAAAMVREEALKVIAPCDSQNHYRKHIEHILNNDPQTEVRALAFVMLEQHYGQNTAHAA